MGQIIEIGKKVKKVPAKIFIEHRYCACGGEMFLKQSEPGEPPKLPHICAVCNKIDYFEVQYPRTIIEEDNHDPLKPILD